MNKIVIGVIISLVVLSMLLAVTGRPINAQGQTSDPEILKKLDEILAGQKTISQKLDTLKEELYIIKIRVTQQQ